METPRFRSVPLGLCLLILSCLCGIPMLGVRGALLVSEAPLTKILPGGGINQNITATFRFSATEAFSQTTSAFSIVGPLYTTPLSLTPRRALQPYTVKTKTFVPPHAEVKIASIYLRPDAYGVNASAGDGATLLDPFGRKPLAYQAALQRSVAELLPGGRQLLGLIPLPGKIGDTINCGIDTFLNKITGNLFGTESSCQAPFPSPDELHSWEAKEDNTFNKLNDFISNATQTFADTATTLSLLANDSAITTAALNSTRVALTALQAYAANTSFMVTVFEKQVGQNLTFIQGEIGNLTNAIGLVRNALTALTLTDGNNFKSVLLDMMNMTAQTNLQFAKFSAVINSDRQKNVANTLQLTEYVRQSSDLLSDAISQKSFKNPSIPMVQNIIQQVRDEGVYDVFLDDLGKAPPNRALLTRSEGATICDVVSISTMWSAPGTGAPMMSVTNYTWWCSKEFLSTRYTAGSWYQYMQLLGPPGCNHTTFSTGRCNSWIEISEQQAQMANGGGPGFVPTPSALVAFANPSLSYIPGNLVQGGAGNIVAGSLDGTLIKSGEDFFGAQTAICQRGSRPDFGFYRVTSYGSRMSLSQIPYNDAACGTESLQELLQPTGDDPYTIMYAFVQMELLAYQSSMSKVNVSDVLGMHPSYMNWDFNPFFRLALGETSVMHIRFAVTSKKADAVEISEINPLPAIVKVDVQIGSGPVVTYDASIRTQSIVSSPLPGSYYAGKKFDVWTGAATLYDAAISEVTPTAWKMSSCGKPTYYGIDDPNKQSRNYWADFNGVEFDAKCGGGSLDIMAETVDFATGRCNLPLASASNGPWCNYLESFKVEPDPIHEILYFVHRFAEIEVSVTIPQGNVEQLLISACPGVQELKTSILSKNFILSNPLNSANTIRVIKSGACSDSEDVDFDPLQNVPYSVSVCPFGGPTIVTFAVLDENDQISSICPMSFNATVVPSESGLQPSPASFNLTEQFRQVTQDVLVTLAQVSSYNTNLIANILFNFMFKTFNAVGIYIPITVLGNYSSTTDIIDQITNNYNDLTNAQSGATFNYDSEFANYTALQAQNAADAQAAIAAEQDAVNQLIANQPSLLADINKVRDDVVNLYKAAGAVINASDDLQRFLEFEETQNPSEIPPATCDSAAFYKFFCNLPDDIGAAGKALGDLIEDPFKALFGGLGSGIVSFITLGLSIYASVMSTISFFKQRSQGKQIEMLMMNFRGGGGGGGYGGGYGPSAPQPVYSVAPVSFSSSVPSTVRAAGSEAASMAAKAIPLLVPPPVLLASKAASAAFAGMRSEPSPMSAPDDPFRELANRSKKKKTTKQQPEEGRQFFAPE